MPRSVKTALAVLTDRVLVKAYGFWRKTGDDAALRQAWPAIRRALSFAWIPGGWDADRDGVMGGCQHNTMDVEYYGPNPQIEFLYLAALDAAARLADVCGDAAFAATCRGVFLVTQRQWEIPENDNGNGNFRCAHFNNLSDYRRPRLTTRRLVGTDYPLNESLLSVLKAGWSRNRVE